MNGKRIFSIMVLVLITAVITLIPLLSIQAAPPHHTSITSDITWDSNKTITTDVVVQNGATLTIKNGVTITADGTQLDPAPYSDGLSPKLEIIVENGGTLIVDEAVLTATGVDVWYGVVFLEGSSGTVTNSTLLYGTVGITIQDASPSITGNTITQFVGEDAIVAGENGKDVIGIAISGTTTSQIQGNSISYLTGGNGKKGVDGAAGINDNAGEDGANGGKGGNAIGISVSGASAEPTISSNSINYLTGGIGNKGGNGGNGADDITSGYGRNGGDGGDGGSGGNITGIAIYDAGKECIVASNIITGSNTGGNAAPGGDGGKGGDGADGTLSETYGGEGGPGGLGGDGGVGGTANAILLSNTSAVVKENSIGGSLTGGTVVMSWASGNGNSGGKGGNGFSAASGDTDGGNGLSGGGGGHGGDGVRGGYAIGILGINVGSTDIRHNDIRAVIMGGQGAAGGNGSAGGAGGNGGDASGNGNGGSAGAGYGGSGGSGGYNGSGGDAFGIWIRNSGGGREMANMNAGVPTIARNTITTVYGGKAATGSGQGDDGGKGGNGGDAPGNGNGGDAGDGGEGGMGSRPESGGSANAYGILIDRSAHVENNLVYDVKGGDPADGGSGGNGGNGGLPGTAHGSGSNGADSSGGDGGDGPKGGTGGKSRGVTLTAYMFTDTNITLTNNTISAINGNDTVSSGGTGGAFGAGSGSYGSAGASGGAGDQGVVYGLSMEGDPSMANMYIVNNIIAAFGTATTEQYGIFVENPITPTLDYNLVYGWNLLNSNSANYKNVSAAAHDVNADPRFTNAAQGEYSLLNVSPAINAGTSSYAGLTYPTDDIDGNGRPPGSKYDIGAHEYGAVPIPRKVYLPIIIK